MHASPDSGKNEERWRRDGLLNIKPHSLRFGEFPEGWDVVETLRRHVASLPHQSIVDFGCGYGRLCEAFDPGKYLGLDINESAVSAAAAAHPGYAFRRASHIDDYPSAGIYLAYTVFLHIDDVALKEVLRKITGAASWLVIAEILDGGDLDKGLTCPFEPHAVYARGKKQYEELLEPFDFGCWEEIRKPYHHYGKAEISLLIFRRNDPPPASIEVPAALADAGLRYEGIYDDGWASETFGVKLSRPSAARFLKVRGMLPAIAPKMSGARIEVLIEGQEGRSYDVTPGDFELGIPLVTGIERPWIRIHCSTPQLLPPPDHREISLLLASIGFR